MKYNWSAQECNVEKDKGATWAGEMRQVGTEV